MPELLGYNRWCAAWPENIPLWARYPIVMDAAGAWPYEWKLQLAGRTPNFPSEAPLQATARYDFTDGDVTVWVVLPSLTGRLTSTFLRIRILGTLAVPTQYERSFSFLQPRDRGWTSDLNLVPWEDDFNDPGGAQSKPGGITIQSTIGVPASAQYTFFRSSRCGEVWPTES